MRYFISCFATFIIINTAHAQLNTCQIFYDAFNTAYLGFPDFRKGQSKSNYKYEIDTAILNKYSLSSGFIYSYRNLPVPDQPGKTYTSWIMILNSGFQSAGDKQWEEIKTDMKKSFMDISTRFYEACFKPQLSMSPILDKDSIDSFIKLQCYFYDASLNISPEADYKKVLNGNTFLKFSLEKGVLLNAYKMVYTIEGVQLEN